MKDDFDKTTDINTLAEWCEFVERFKFDRPGFDEILDEALAAINKVKERRNFNGMRVLYRDLTESTRGLAPEEQLELDRQLLRCFGHGLKDSHKDLEKSASLILKRGKLANADEYRILESWLDFILGDPSKKDQIEQIETLLGPNSTFLSD